MEICRSILVVDDNEDIRDAICLLLKEQHFDVAMAKDGRDAFKQLKKLNPPTLILLDLMMPVMNGWEFMHMRKLWNEQSDPIITISAVRQELNSIDVDATDVLANITKPIDFYKLIEVVNRYCTREDSKVADL